MARLPHRTPIPSRRFTRPQGFAPPRTCRPCSMPVPFMGFSLQGRSPPAERYTLSDAAALLRLILAGRVPLSGPPARTSTSRPCSLRASVPIIRRFRPDDWPQPSWVFPPQGLLLSRHDPLGSPLMGLAPGVHEAPPFAALQSLTGVTVGWTLSSLPPLSRFVTFPAFLTLHGVGLPGLPLQSLSCVATGQFPVFGFPSPLPRLVRSAASVTAF